MKKNKIIFWTATLLIFLFEGLMPAFTSQTEIAKEGIRHLGYPNYFSIMLTVFKVLGALVILIPAVPHRIKEWAYAGFTFELIAAFVSHWVEDGLGGQTFFPIIVLAVLMISYFYYHKLSTAQQSKLKIATA